MIDYKEEIRNGYVISTEMKKVWNIQINMAQYIIDVCNRNNLRIWADGGTLLGTVRHKGYIPWDDDIDLLMFREDYDKLIAISDKEFKYPYFLQSAYTDNNYYRGHAQMRYANTAAILPSDIYSSFNQSIFIDIFVYDSIPNVEDINWKRRLIRADKIQKILNAQMVSKCVSLRPLNILLYYWRKLYCKFISPIKLFKEYEDLFRFYKYDECERISCPTFMRNTFKFTTKQKDWYRETLWLPFENIELPVPVDYDKVLSTQYGENYMTPQKAPSIHGKVIFDTEHSYLELLPILRKKYRKTIVQRIHDKFFKG